MILRRVLQFSGFSDCSTVFLLLYVWSVSVIGALAGCPKVCECKWRDGKEVVFCRDAHFIDIPRGLAPSTQVLDLQHNNLRILPKDSFVYTGLVSLQKVRLSHCNLMRVEEGAFRNLANVFELDISNNLLKSVPSAALQDMGGLRELRIAHNSLTYISSSTFLSTPDLVELDISHNSISAIEAGSLKHLINLEVLDISENKIQIFQASDLLPLTVLRVINIDGNPWHCDCQLKPLRKWLNDYGLTPSPPPACSQPRWLFGQKWQFLELDDFVCAPKVSAIAPRVLASEGEDVTLVCHIESESETTITWLVGDTSIQYINESLRFFVSEIAVPKNKYCISNLTMTGVVPQDQGVYRCVAENKAGYGEVNITLQVSHEVAEVRAANVEPASYLNSALFLGVLAVICIVLLMCSLIYCKLRSGQVSQQQEEKADMSQSSRSSNEDAQVTTGYHIIPTNELEDESQRLQSHQHSWLAGGAGRNDNLNEGRDNDKTNVIFENSPRSQAPKSTNASYVEIPKSGEGVVRTTLEEQVQYKDVIIDNTSAGCAQPRPQIATNIFTGYSDPVNYPLSDGQGNAFGLHTINSSYCTIPRGRSKSNSEASGAKGDTKTHSNINHPHNFAYRSSSALNLFMSEAACSAYAQGQSSMKGHSPLPGRSSVDQDHRSVQDLLAVQREDFNGRRRGGGQDPYRFEYHAAQLEKFLQEYRSLQQQLQMMKQSYQAHHRTGSVPKLDCCMDISGVGTSSVMLDPSTNFSSQYFNNPCIPLKQASATEPFKASLDLSASTETFKNTSSQYFCTLPQSLGQYPSHPLSPNTGSHSPSAAVQPYPGKSQCYAPASELSQPCLGTSLTTPLLPYATVTPPCLAADRQICPFENEGGNKAGEGCKTVTLSCDLRPSSLCSEVPVSSTMTFSKSNMLKEGVQDEEPLKSILKKTSSPDTKTNPKTPKQPDDHQSALKKKQVALHWKS